MQSLLIIDTSYLIYRSYFAYPLLSYNGVSTGAYYGFVKAIMQMYQELNPQTIVFATDTPQKTWRHEEYGEYKATRSAPDAAMISQIPLILEWCKAVTPNVFGLSGYEADDIIGTVSKQYVLNNELGIAQKQESLLQETKSRHDMIQDTDSYDDFFPKQQRYADRESLIFSSDKDLYQLLSTEGVMFVRSKNKTTKASKTTDGQQENKNANYELYGYKDFIAQYGLNATQWVDAKALIGDNSDNLPGLPSVGPKTAAAILHEVGYLYYLYQALGYDVTGFRHGHIVGDWEVRAQAFVANPKKAKYIQLFKDHYEQVKQIYNLATLSDVGALSVSYTNPEFDKGLPLLEKYGFKSLIQTTNAITAQFNQPESLF